MEQAEPRATSSGLHERSMPGRCPTPPRPGANAFLWSLDRPPRQNPSRAFKLGKAPSWRRLDKLVRFAPELSPIHSKPKPNLGDSVSHGIAFQTLTGLSRVFSLLLIWLRFLV